MTIGERDRRRLQEALVDSLGSDPADTLMGYLPPVGWADVATKQDLQTLQTVIHSEINELGAGLRREVSEFRSEMHQVVVSQTYRMMGFFVALSAVLVAALKLT